MNYGQGWIYVYLQHDPTCGSSLPTDWCLKMPFYKLAPGVNNTVLNNPVITNCNTVTINDNTIYSLYEGASGHFSNLPSYLINPEYFHWDFGDGFNHYYFPNSTVSHTYEKPCIYTISLTKDLYFGLLSEVDYNTLPDPYRQKTDCQTVFTKTVDLYPKADFTLPTPIVCADASVQFVDNSTCHDFIESYLWNFGDGSPTSDSPSPSHHYTIPGTYHVTLTIYSIPDCHGNSIPNTITHDVTIGFYPTVANISSSDPDNNICLGDVITLQGSSPTQSANCVWSPYNPYGQFIPLDPCTYIVQPTITTNYTLNLTDVNGCTASDDVTVTVNPKPETPIIIGYNNDCHSNKVTYSTEDNSDYTFHWSINPASGIFSNGTTQYVGNTVEATWNNLLPSGSAFIELYAVNAETGCTSDIAKLNVFPCCIPKDPQLMFNDETVTSDTPITYSGNDGIGLNGTVVFDADITFNDCKIYMGPDAKIIVETGHTLEILNYSIVSAGCQYMWDGIYLNDKNTEGSFQNSTVSGGQNAVVSSNGGVFKIDGCSFYKNFINVKVKDYTPLIHFGQPNEPHHGLIYGTQFIGSVHLPYPPYQNQKTYAGITADKVYDLTIGNPAKGSNTFSTMRYGVKSLNSYLKIYNNSFDNIYLNSAYLSWEAGFNYSLPAEGAIISYFNKTQFMPYAMERKLFVGDYEDHYANYFYNCNQGIYSRSLIAGIDNNIFSNIKGGAVYSINVENNSYFMRNEIENVTYGIRVQNTSPAVFGQKVTIDDNIIDNPKKGIWLTNLSSYTVSHRQSTSFI